ncbi:hypothetical protein JCM11251_004827 [Rhodosporidiobolus azoricus]
MRVKDLDIVALQKRRDHAMSRPLREGDILTPSGPALNPSAITPLLSALSARDAVLADEPPLPYRSPNVRLRDLAVEPGRWRHLSFRLVDGLCVGPDSWAQVWQVDVLEAGRSIGQAVLKLLAQALFWLDYPRDDFWIPADEASDAEAQAYILFGPLQGRDVPHCYGNFSFTLPWGESATGFVLEDLSPYGTELIDHCDDARDRGAYQTADEADPLITSAYHTLHRLQQLGVTAFELSPGDIHVLHTSPSDLPRVVFSDFGMTQPSGPYAEKHEAFDAEHDGQMGPWQADDETRLQILLQRLLGEAGYEWHEREQKEDHLRLHMHCMLVEDLDVEALRRRRDHAMNHPLSKGDILCRCAPTIDSLAITPIPPYAAFRSLQGRDVPHCYGAFPFAMPWGETVTGVVLEDLTLDAVPIYEYIEETQHGGGYETAEAVDALMSTAYRTLHRLHRLDIGGFELSPGDLFVLKSSSSSNPQLVFLDFGATESATEGVTDEDEGEEPEDSDEESVLPWQAADEGALQRLFEEPCMLPEVAEEWLEMEAERDLLKLFMHQ